MNIISICIPTYKRPEMLKKLIGSILECYIKLDVIKKINIIIVDNDPSKSAETVAKNYISQTNFPFVFYYDMLKNSFVKIG
jgi:glycosyltransferase involved in cell wall biosynthesis